MLYENMPAADSMVNVVPLLILIIFGFIVVIIIYRVVNGVKQFAKNESSPVLTVNAKVVAKRTKVSRHVNHVNDALYTQNSTSYFATFEVESGDRMEMLLKGKEYGLLAEGDTGMLTFQGTRYLAFKRTGMQENF